MNEELKKEIAIRMSMNDALNKKDIDVIQEIFLKIRERIMQMEAKNITISQAQGEIEVKLPCAIYFKDHEAIHYFTRLILRTVFDGDGQEYGGGVYVISLREVDCNGMFENQISMHSIDKWIYLFEKLDCMNFWNDEYMQFYE